MTSLSENVIYDIMKREILNSFSLEEKIGQMFMVGFSGEILPSKVEEFIKRSNIGFVVLFSRNVSSPEQVISLTSSIHSSSRIPPMIFTDQEGGIVSQLGEMASTFTSPMGLAATGKPKFSEIEGKIIGKDLKILGIDGVLAPVGDVNREPDNPIIGIRSFSDDPKIVIKFAKAFIKGAKNQGIAPVLKHFPGHGGTKTDSHLSLPSVDETEEDFRKFDLKPFTELSKKNDFIMSAHVSYPQIDPSGFPATFSKKILSEILREELGFEGIALTDCLEMNAIWDNFTPEEMINYAIEAGADVLLSSHTLDLQKELYSILLKLVKQGKISEERINISVERILRVKKNYGILSPNKKKPFRKVGKLRAYRKKEDLICQRAIVLLRDKTHKLPLARNAKLGIIEWEKATSTVPISETQHKSYLEKRAKEYFSRPDVLILPLQIPDFTLIKDFVKSHDEILLAPYSRTPEVERIQGKVIRKILQIRGDAIVASLGNPYDIRQFPQVNTYLLSFGFRDCQVKALFDALSGKVKPSGKLPVNFEGILTDDTNIKSKYHKS